jgi:hypothetical protein
MPTMSLRVAVAAYESFHDAFADVPPSTSRGFVDALIPYMLARISWAPGAGVFGATVPEPGGG